MVAVVEHMGEDFVSEQAGRVGDMTDWLPTDELAARLGVNSYELLDALAAEYQADQLAELAEQGGA